MKILRNGLLMTGLVLLISSGVFAEDIFIKNRLFKGPSTGSGNTIQVGVESILKSLKLKDYKIQDGTLLIGGKTLTLSQGGEEPMVSLKELASALDGKMIVNSDLGTVDFHKGTGKMAAAPEPSAAKKTGCYEAPGSVVVVVVVASQSEPGGTVALEKSMVFGKENIDRWDSPVAKQFQIKSVPAFRVYDKTRKLKSEGKNAYSEVLGLIKP